MMLRILFPSVLLVGILTLVLTSLGYQPLTYRAPIIVGIPLVALLAVELWKQSRYRQKQPDAVEEETSAAVTPRGYLAGAGWIALLLLLIYLVGYLLAIPAFVFVYLKRHGANWFTTIMVVLGAIALLAIFERILEVYLYRGLLFILLGAW